MKKLTQADRKEIQDGVDRMYDGIHPAAWRHLRAHKRIKKLVWRARWIE